MSDTQLLLETSAKAIFVSSAIFTEMEEMREISFLVCYDIIVRELY